MIALLRKEPFVIAQRTASSRDWSYPLAFSALTARSSPKTAVVFCVAILLATPTSSASIAISSKSAKIPAAIYIIPFFVE